MSAVSADDCREFLRCGLKPRPRCRRWAGSHMSGRRPGGRTSGRSSSGGRCGYPVAPSRRDLQGRVWWSSTVRAGRRELRPGTLTRTWG
ncbi:hypothetical protein HBB16_10090 [Pseudonocardia sp. MCCB 268]|nr:hypothetical protein [Pseudonocardia cytotoxica]